MSVQVIITLKENIASLIPNAEAKAIDALQQAASMLRDTMMEEGAPSTSPVQWDSDKQRKAYFATNGFGAGIPYQRTHRYEQGWRVTHIVNGAQLDNSFQNAVYISGSPLGGGQSRIHQGRWNVIADKLLGVIDWLSTKLEESMQSVRMDSQ